MEKKPLIKIRNSNGYAAFIVLAVLVIIFIGYYVIMGPYAKIYSIFMENDDYYGLSESECLANDGYWTDNECYEFKSRAVSVINKSRRAWLVAPFILFLGMILWYYSVIGKNDPRLYDITRWR